MAASKSIRESLEALTGNILEAQEVARACSDLVFDIDPKPPAWVFVFDRQVDRIQVAAEALECLIRQKALPLMEDVEMANQKR